MLAPRRANRRVRSAAEDRRLNQLMDNLERGLSIQYASMVRRAKAKLKDNSNLQEAAKVIAAEAIKYTAALERAYLAVARAETARLSRALNRPLKFNPNHEVTARFISEARRRFLQGFNSEQRQTISQAIVRASRYHLGQEEERVAKAAVRNPKLKGQARLRGAARDALGLTPHQEGIVENYRRALAANSPEAITGRRLRDKRFDNTVQNAVDSNEPLSWKQINRMTDRYRERWVVHRAKTIARTQALITVNTARHDALNQAAGQANFDPNDIVRTWNAVMDSRTRDSHAALDGYEVNGMDEPFPADGGPLLYPGDPNGPPEEIINCRCWLTYSLPGENEVEDDS